MTDNPYRLPRLASPTRYDVELAPDLGAATFAGTVAVQLDVGEATDELVCNAADLEIDAAWVVVGEDGERLDAVAKLDEATERLHLGLPSRVGPGPVRAHLAFRGVLNDKLRGFYRSTFTDEAGTTHTIATTQMESTDCRRAFPCWDEPDFKAVFGVTLVVPADLLAISNGPEIERTDAGDGKVRIRFADTMSMSTYLVAFVVGPLEATPPVDVEGIPLRVVHVPGKASLTAFPLDVGAFSLRWFQDYYGIDYPGDKVDLVALPDFAAGAMENLGCITFREDALLVDPKAATQQEEQRVADVVAHELAHMWFGDLVTMKWWNGIWLNEAFATFMEIDACDSYRPEWQRWTNFGLERTAAFEVDSLTSTRPVEFEVVSPSDAEGMFDVLTYLKGGALLRMLQQYLGEEQFRDGIRYYLRQHSYGNTETADLWDALEHTSGKPVRRIMDSWIWQGGYPLVSARLSEDGASVVLEQRRFLFANGASGAADVDARWAIPVGVREMAGGSAHDHSTLLDGDEVTIPLTDPGASPAVLVNADSTGFFRVRYDDALLDRLTGHTLAALSTAERYSLVDDAWAAVVAGAMTADAFCDLARSFADERDLPVWQILLAGLRWCDRFVAGEARERLRGYVRALVAPALLRLGWEPAKDEDDLTGELRGTLIRSLGVLGDDPDTKRRARELHARAVAEPTSIDPTVAAAVLTVVAASGDEADYEGCIERFRSARTPQDMIRELYALADFPTAELMDRTLTFAISDDVRTQNSPFLLQRCIAHRDHGERAWRFVRGYWDQANARFPKNTIVRMVDSVKTLTRPEQQADVAAFFAEHPIPQAAKTLEQILERQRINVALRGRAEAALSDAEF